MVNFLIKVFVTLVLSLFCFSGCANNLTKHGVPCWLTDLSDLPGTSIYGVARPYSASNLPPEHFAKLNAVNNWRLANGLDKIKTKQNLAKQESFITADTELYFNDLAIVDRNYYALVSDRKIDLNDKSLCQLDTCQLQQCQPDWLCQGQRDQITLLGVSAPATHPNDPIRHMVRNAQEVARTANLASVVGEIFMLNIDSNYEKSSNLQQTFQIDALEKRINPVKVGKMCHYKGTLVSEINFAFGRVFRGHDWFNQPNFGQRVGAIGHAKGMTSTGRMSDLINLAARRGLFALAKANNINVENDVTLSISNGGYYSLIRKTHQTTESLVSAFIADMKMELNEKAQPEIYIWLLENKGKL